MKSLLKFMSTIIVILAIGFTVYFLIENMSHYTSQDSEDMTQSGNNIDKNIENNEESGENLIDSDDKNLINDWDAKVEAIKNIESQNKSAIPNKTLEDNVGIEIIGKEFQSFFEAFQTEEVAVTVQVAGSMIYILPASDFIDNMQFHYDENGKLILYVREFVGIGGESRYYFENDEPIIINMDVEKKTQMNFESVEEIVQRSKIVYDRYMK